MFKKFTTIVCNDRDRDRGTILISLFEKLVLFWINKILTDNLCSLIISEEKSYSLKEQDA